MPKYVGQHSFIKKTLSPASSLPASNTSSYVPQQRQEWPPKNYASLKKHYEDLEDSEYLHCEEDVFHFPSTALTSLNNKSNEFDDDLDYLHFDEEDNQKETDSEGNRLPPAFYVPQGIFSSRLSNKTEDNTSLSSSNEHNGITNSGTESPPPTPNAERSATPPALMEAASSPTVLPKHLVVFHAMLAATFEGAKDKENNPIDGEKLARSFINILHLEKATSCTQTPAPDGKNITYTFDYNVLQKGSVDLGRPGKWNITLGPQVAITLDVENKLLTFAPEGAPKGLVSLKSIRLLPHENGHSSRFEITSDSRAFNFTMSKLRKVSANTIVRYGTPGFVELKNA